MTRTCPRRPASTWLPADPPAPATVAAAWAESAAALSVKHLTSCPAQPNHNRGGKPCRWISYSTFGPGERWEPRRRVVGPERRVLRVVGSEGRAPAAPKAQAAR
jgi:hypothetical protein